MNRLTLFACLLAVAACGRNEAPADAPATGSSPASAPATGATVVVHTITDEKGSRFEPARIEVHPGDIVRLTLVSGVHNMSFPPAANPSGATLPGPTDMLQLPGQTFDLAVNLPAGTYHFQCDPHAALGMTGELVVQ